MHFIMSKQPKVIYKDQQDTGMMNFGRDHLEEIYAQAFKAEDAMVVAQLFQVRMPLLLHYKVY